MVGFMCFLLLEFILMENLLCSILFFKVFMYIFMVKDCL